MSGAAVGRLVLVLLVLANTACVATDAGELQGLPVCAMRSDDPSRAIVRLRIQGPESSVWCNGVLIAPDLVLTATSCLTARLPEAEFNLPPCESVTGAPFETGGFEARYLVVDSANISVRDGNQAIDSTVESMFISEAASACLPDIAVLSIQPALELPTVALRLEQTSQAGDLLSLNGYDNSEGTPAQHTTDVVVVDATSHSGNDRLPPRSLLLSGRACTGEGGAVLARDTNALVGLVVTSSLTINCDAVAEGPLAVQIAPFS